MDELDQGMAKAQKALKSLKPDAITKALPPGGAPIPFPPAKRKLTKAWLNELYSSNKPYMDKSVFKGITKAKGMSVERYAAWLTERGINVDLCWSDCLTFPSPTELLAYWRNQGSPSLSPSN